LQSLKTPSLGLVWTNQLACRIALIKQPVLNKRTPFITDNGEILTNDDEAYISRWRRYFKVVYAPWVPPTDGRGVEFEIVKNGVRSISKEK
jgi:DNA repair protein RAD57